MPLQDRKPNGLEKADININKAKKYKGYIFFTNRALNPCKEEPQIQAKRIKRGPTYPEVGNKKQPTNKKFLPRLYLFISCECGCTRRKEGFIKKYLPQYSIIKNSTAVENRYHVSWIRRDKTLIEVTQDGDKHGKNLTKKIVTTEDMHMQA